MCNNPDVGNGMFDNFMLIIVFMSLSMWEHSDTAQFRYWRDCHLRMKVQHWHWGGEDNL